MKSMTDVIEQMLMELLNEGDGIAEIQRNILANRLNCVPSQINYVIQTRFTPERGYSIESRRGGGGGVRIIRVSPDETNYLMHVINSVGNELDYQTARVFVQNLVDYECLSLREAKLILGALRDSAIPMQGGARNRLRAAIFKNMLLALQ
ncbi:MAG: CtsR family transcriptional regulator [Oscillospiraceae bacterium]|nr:CtsR family transcriptional regulator [Oscillospiraceae bacterium]